MRVLDVFSNLPAIELSIEQIEDIFLKSCEGVIDDTYPEAHALPYKYHLLLPHRTYF